MAYTGVNFRETAGYVTDGSGETYCLGDVYPTTRASQTFGFTSSIAGNTRDRSSTFDRRLAGINFVNNSGSPTVFVLDLPKPGKYKIRLALGDASSSQRVYCVIKDGTTTRATIGPTDVSITYWVDATGTQYADNSWPNQNVTITQIFASGKLTLELGGSAGGTGVTTISHVSYELINSDIWDNDWESYAHLSNVSDFVSSAGAPFIILDETIFAPMPAPQGIKSWGASDDGYQNYLAAAPANLANQGIRGSTSFVPGHSIAHLLRHQSAGLTGYMCYYDYNGTAIRLNISTLDSGTISLDSSSYFFNVNAGDVFWFESLVNVTTIEMRVWAGSVNNRPVSPSHSLTTTYWATGRPGFRKVGNGTYANTDETRIVSDPADFAVVATPVITLTAPTPSSGLINVISANFTVSSTLPVTGPTVVTPSAGAGGGTFNPTSVTIDVGTPTATFTYTPTSVGVKSITVTNNTGLDNPSVVSYTVSEPLATTMTINLKLNDGVSAAANVTGIEYVILNSNTLATSTSVVDNGSGESTNASGQLVLDISGAGITVGQVRYVVTGKSNGTVGADFDGWHGPAVAS